MCWEILTLVTSSVLVTISVTREVSVLGDVDPENNSNLSRSNSYLKQCMKFVHSA
jgi:hypothetical protein